MNEELKKLVDSLFEGKDFALKSDLNEIKTAIESEIKKLGDNSEMEKKIGSLNEALNSINEELKKAKASNTPETKFVDFGELGARAMKSMIEKGSSQATESVKAGEVFTSSITGGTTLNVGIEPGVDKPALPRYVFELFSRRPWAKGFVEWTEQASNTNGAGVKTEGTAAGQTIETWKAVKKFMDRISTYAHFSRELEEDLSILANELRADLSDNMDKAVSAKVYTDLLAAATAFNATAIKLNAKIVAPNIMDVIMAAATQVATANLTPTVVAINPIDAALMQMTKGTNEVYTLPPFWASDRQIAGMQVFVSNEIAQNTMVVMDASKPVIYDHINKEVKIVDQDQDDAIKGMKKAIAYQSVCLRVRANEAKGVVKVTDIAAAITALKKAAA